MSPHYTRFKKLCHTAFTSLRKNSNLILNLIALMVDANVPDIRFEPDKAVLKVSKLTMHMPLPFFSDRSLDLLTLFLSQRYKNDSD